MFWRKQGLTRRQAAHETALVLHRINENLLALAKLQGLRLQVEQQQLAIALEQLEMSRAARVSVEAARTESGTLTQMLVDRVFELMHARTPAAAAPVGTAGPALEDPPAPARPRVGLRVG